MYDGYYDSYFVQILFSAQTDIFPRRNTAEIRERIQRNAKS
jgi:hypothetical protein